MLRRPHLLLRHNKYFVQATIECEDRGITGLYELLGGPSGPVLRASDDDLFDRTGSEFRQCGYRLIDVWHPRGHEVV